MRKLKAIKILKSLLPVALMLIVIAGCADQEAEKTPSELIVGNWEYRNQSWCEFESDNTCIIGGTAGEYSIDENNTITLSVYGSDEANVFEWAGSADAADFDHWYVDENNLYINGMQYPRMEDDEISDTADAASDSQAAGEDSSETEAETEAAESSSSNIEE